MTKGYQANQTAFRLFTEKKFSDVLKDVSWCPTMDLLATLFNDGSVDVWRLSWTRVFHYSPREDEGFPPATSFTWSPDGKVLALGCTTGIVYLFNIEHQALMHSFRIQEKANFPVKELSIQSMHWLEDKTPRQEEQWEIIKLLKPIANYLPPLSHLPEFGSRRFSENKTKKFEYTIDEEKPVDTMVIEDSLGTLHFNVFGFLHIAKIEQPEGNELKGFSASPDLSQIFFVSQGCSQNSDKVRKGQDIAAMEFKTEVLTKHRSHVRLVASDSLTCDSLVNYVIQSLHLVKKEYTTGRDLHKRFVSKLLMTIEDKKETLTPKGSFLQLLVNGTAEPAMYEFIQDYLTLREFKRWEAGCESAMTNMQQYCHEYLIQGCDRLILYLSDLKNSSLNTKDSNAKETQKGIIVIGVLLGRIYEFLKLLKSELEGFREFMGWLHNVIYRMESDNKLGPDKKFNINYKIISKFIQTSIEDNPLKRFFADTPEDIALFEKSIEKQVENAVNEKGVLRQHPKCQPAEMLSQCFDFVFMSQSGYNISFDVVSMKLNQLVQTIFNNEAEAFGKHFSLDKMEVRLPCQRAEMITSRLIQGNDGKNRLFIAFLYEHDLRRKVSIHCFRFEGNTWVHGATELQPPEGETSPQISMNPSAPCPKWGIVSIEFYDNKYLAMVIFDQKEDAYYFGIINFMQLEYHSDSSSSELCFEKLRLLVNFKPNGIACNGVPSRELVCIYGQQQVQIFDMKEDEMEEGDDDNDEEDQKDS